VFFSEITSLRSVYDDMSIKPCDNCKMIMVNSLSLRVAELEIHFKGGRFVAPQNSKFWNVTKIH
jgi:hypothetical protein